jgi:hypothetical protein
MPTPSIRLASLRGPAGLNLVSYFTDVPGSPRVPRPPAPCPLSPDP